MFKIKYEINNELCIGRYFRYKDDNDYFRVVEINKDNWICKWIHNNTYLKVDMDIDTWSRCIANRDYIIISENEVPEEFKVPLNMIYDI